MVGYAIGSRKDSLLAIAAIENAVSRSGDLDERIVYSDQGSQFQSRAFKRALTDQGLTSATKHLNVQYLQPSTAQFLTLFNRSDARILA